MIFDSKELIRHVKADEMASTYSDAIPRIFEAIAEIRKQSSRLREAFAGAGRGWAFDLKIESRDGCSDEESIRREFKRDAWSALIDKLGVKKYMATGKRDQLEKILNDSCRYRDRSGIDNFPDITPENMLAVLSAYICNIDEFLIESVKEQFDYWCGRRWNDDYKTNRERFRISCKIVARWMVEQGYSRSGFRVTNGSEKYVAGLDNIFHYLDGRGFPKEHKGNLVSAIEMSENGSGSSDYFKFRCFKNRNLHLTCLRPDLLEMFNDIACDKAIPSQLRLGEKTLQ